MASCWRERETEREGPAFVPTDVDDIALHKDGLLLMGHKGGAVTYAPLPPTSHPCVALFRNLM